MLIEIVRCKANFFSRESIESSQLSHSTLKDPSIIAYRFVPDDLDSDQTDIYDWNLCHGLKEMLKPVPSNITPELLYLFRDKFLSRVSDLFSELKQNSTLDDIAIFNMLLHLSIAYGKETVLFDKALISEYSTRDDITNMPKEEL